MDAEYAQAMLRSLWLGKGNGTLLNALNARLQSLIGKTQDGTFLASTSAGGVSASFFSAKTQDPTDMAKLVNRLIALYEKHVALSEESAIYAAMLGDDELQEVTEYTGDFRRIHAPYIA